MQPPDTSESYATPLRSAVSNTNLAGGEVEVRFPVRIDRADVAPVRPAFDHVDARVGEAMRKYAMAMSDQVRNHVPAEVMVRRGIVDVTDQRLVEERRVEHVDPHAGDRDVPASRRRFRMRRLFLESDDASFVVERHHAVLRCYADRDFDAADRHVGKRIRAVASNPLDRSELT